jgi:EAP30/Vps36 family
MLLSAHRLYMSDKRSAIYHFLRNCALQTMHSALQRQAWVKTSVTEVVAKLAAAARGGDSNSMFNEGAGIAGILRRQEAARAATSQIASEAFSDLSSLMDKAKDVVSSIALTPSTDTMVL